MQIRIVYLDDERRAAGWALLCVRDLMMTSDKRSAFNNGHPGRIDARTTCNKSHQTEPGQRAQLAPDNETLRTRDGPPDLGGGRLPHL